MSFAEPGRVRPRCLSGPLCSLWLSFSRFAKLYHRDTDDTEITEKTTQRLRSRINYLCGVPLCTSVSSVVMFVSQLEPHSLESVNQPAGNRPIAINSSVAQKRPIPSRIFEHAQINVADHNFFFIMRGLRDHTPKRICQKRSSPELQAFSRSFLPANIALLKSNTVHRGHVDSV